MNSVKTAIEGALGGFGKLRGAGPEARTGAEYLESVLMYVLLFCRSRST